MTQNEYEEDEQICPGCGAPEDQWVGFNNKGFIGATGELYCCQDCAEGRTCNCNPERLEALVKSRAI